jgi:predicted O-methyltransferase YrrM
MIRIRPHKLFNLIKTDSYTERAVKLVLPDQNTPVTFDMVIKLALAKLIRPRTFFEFGTFLGVQTFNMAMNLPDCEFYTLDLDEESYKKASIVEAVRHLSEIQLERQQQLAFRDTPYEARIHCLRGDSNVFDFRPYDAKMDMIYVDGGHDERTVHSDTENAFRMLSKGRPAVIAWDDYGNPLSPAVKEYLDTRGEDLVFVEESLTVFHLSGLSVDIG